MSLLIQDRKIHGPSLLGFLGPVGHHIYPRRLVFLSMSPFLPRLEKEIVREMAEVEAVEENEKIAEVNGKPHRLERKWTFWFDNQSKAKPGAAWGASLRKAYTFDTVEEFWWYDLYEFMSIKLF